MLAIVGKSLVRGDSLANVGIGADKALDLSAIETKRGDILDVLVEVLAQGHNARTGESVSRSLDGKLVE